MSISVGNVTTAASNVYVSAGATAITFMSLCNYTAGNVTANVYVVPSGSSAGNANIVLASIDSLPWTHINCMPAAKSCCWTQATLSELMPVPTTP
jgi:hypothetical protein